MNILLSFAIFVIICAVVILLDQKKQQLMRLNPQSPTCKIELDARNRYYLRWEFKGVTGKCELRW